MELQKIKFSRLRNGEHAEFHSEVDDLITGVTPQVLGITVLYPPYKSVLNSELEAVHFIRKSAISDELEVIDQPRDALYRGLYDTVKGSLGHFNPEVKKAAARVMVVLDLAGNIARLPYDEETLAIKKMINELNNNYAADVETLGIADWLSQLGDSNYTFEQLLKSRYTEETGKTEIRMKSIRKEVEKEYLRIMKRIEALIELNGEEPYSQFVNEVNRRVVKYKNKIAIRQGRNQEGEEGSDEAK